MILMVIPGVKGIPSNPENPRKLTKPHSNGMVILYDEQTGYSAAVMLEISRLPVR